MAGRSRRRGVRRRRSDLVTRKLARDLAADHAGDAHADAGYGRAIEVAEERGVRIPMRAPRGLVAETPTAGPRPYA